MSDRIIEQDGRRYRYIWQRVPRPGEMFNAQFGGEKTGELICCQQDYGPRDIYELIEEKPMLKHVIAGQESEQPKLIHWRLVPCGNVVRLMADDLSREAEMAVLTIHEDGTARRVTSVRKSLGLPLDERGRIKLVE